MAQRTKIMGQGEGSWGGEQSLPFPGYQPCSIAQHLKPCTCIILIEKQIENQTRWGLDREHAVAERWGESPGATESEMTWQCPRSGLWPQAQQLEGPCQHATPAVGRAVHQGPAKATKAFSEEAQREEEKPEEGLMGSSAMTQIPKDGHQAHTCLVPPCGPWVLCVDRRHMSLLSESPGKQHASHAGPPEHRPFSLEEDVCGPGPGNGVYRG